MNVTLPSEAHLVIIAAAFTLLGSALSSFLRYVSNKKTSNADAADKLVDAAGNLADRLSRLNTHLEQENRRLRTSILLLTDVVDRIIPLVNAPPAVLQELRAASAAAKVAMLSNAEENL